MFRCGNGGEVFIRWNRLQSNNVFDGATRTVHGDCSGERECVDWDRTVAAFIRCIYRWFFSWSLPHHRHCYSYLHPGSSPSVPLSYFSFFFLLGRFFLDVTSFLALFDNIWFLLLSTRDGNRRARADVIFTLAPHSFVLSLLRSVPQNFTLY